MLAVQQSEPSFWYARRQGTRRLPLVTRLQPTIRASLQYTARATSLSLRLSYTRTVDPLTSVLAYKRLYASYSSERLPKARRRSSRSKLTVSFNFRERSARMSAQHLIGRIIDTVTSPHI